MAKAHKKHGTKRREASSSIEKRGQGTFMGIKIVVVKPRGTTVRKIREAVAAAARKRA
jgi:hypothetical protein